MGEIVRDKAFARRLHQAAEDRPDVPPFGLGRQTWIKERMGVSHEAVRKWLTGESRPRPIMMSKLAKLFGVDEAWLSLGIASEIPTKQREARNAMADGAVNAFTGLVQMNGGHCAFPGPDDPRNGYVDVYAIIRGSQFSVHVAFGEMISNGVYKFSVPKEYPNCTVVGAIHFASMRCIYLNLRQSLIDKHRFKKGSYFEITVHASGDQFTTGSDVWPIIDNLVDKI